MSRKTTEVDTSDNDEVLIVLNDISPKHGRYAVPTMRQSHGQFGANLGKTQAFCDSTSKEIDLTSNGRSKETTITKSVSNAPLQPNSFSRKRLS